MLEQFARAFRRLSPTLVRCGSSCVCTNIADRCNGEAQKEDDKKNMARARSHLLNKKKILYCFFFHLLYASAASSLVDFAPSTLQKPTMTIVRRRSPLALAFARPRAHIKSFHLFGPPRARARFAFERSTPTTAMAAAAMAAAAAAATAADNCDNDSRARVAARSCSLAASSPLFFL